MISVQYEAPGERLAKLVSSFYRLDFEGDSFSELERADRAQFRFQLRGSGEYHFAGGHIAQRLLRQLRGRASGRWRGSGRAGSHRQDTKRERDGRGQGGEAWHG